MEVIYYILYMVKNDSKLLSIRAIFERDDNNSFTDTALFYQDILKYQIKTGNNEFNV